MIVTKHQITRKKKFVNNNKMNKEEILKTK